MLQGANVFARDSHSYFVNRNAGTGLRFCYRGFDGLNGLGNIVHNTFVNAQTFCFSNAEDFNFSVGISSTDNRHNLCGTDVEAY